MSEELEINKLVVHHWKSQVNDSGRAFNCDYWDCPRNILQGEPYYNEEYPDGQVESYCLKCSAFFMSQAVNTLIDHISEKEENK